MGSSTRDGIRIYIQDKKALYLSIYQTPRVPDEDLQELQQIHSVSKTKRAQAWADSVALPVYSADWATKWLTPRSSEFDSVGRQIIHFLIPVKSTVDRELILLRIITLVTPHLLYILNP
jgi:hypothetical protein